ncbi:MAG: lantibiotic dehydratase [Acidimicrobiales bacterium]
MMADPVWMLRINPLRRCRLADSGIAELLDEAASRSRAAVPLAKAASDDLYRLVPATAEPLRGALLALRRDIHNGRGDADGAEQLPIAVPPSVARWSENHRRLRTCQQEVRQMYRSALVAERSRLRALLGDDDFLVTLAQSAPGVYDAALRYRGHTQPDSKDRKAERALLQYLTRAMVRTSPYGRFTAVALARPDPSGVSMAAVGPDGARPLACVDRAVFDYVVGGLLPPGDDPLVAVPPSARIADGKITFFQVGPDALRRLSAPMTGHTKVLVELLDVGARRRSALATALAERLELKPEAADRLVGMGLQLGLLVSVWRGDEFVAEPGDQAVQDLSTIGADRVPDGLRQLRAGIARLSDTADVDTVATRIAAIREVERVGQDLGRLAGRPARLTVNEDVMLDPLRVDPGPYGPALDHLAVVAELASAFDRVHVARALVASALVARFGPGCRVNLVDNAPWLVGAVYQGERHLTESPDGLAGPSDGSVQRLTKLRDEVVGALADDLSAVDTGQVELAWSPDRVADLVSGLPECFRQDPASYAMVVQPDGEQLVLNDAYAGHGPMLSRFLHADALRGGDAKARLGERLAHLYGNGRLVEDRSCHGVGINVHPPILADSLDPAAWQRLELAHDTDSDSIAIVDEDGMPVRVLSLGAQLPELFPYPVRLASWLCSSGRVVLDLVDKVHRRLRLSGPGPGPTVAYPRLCVGRVTLSRRRWYPGADFPAAPDSPDEAGYLLAVTAWRACHLVPAEVVLKSVFDGPVLWESLVESGPRERFFELRSQSKPQYVDLASAVMTRVLPRLLERRPPGIVEEARPAMGAGGHAAEWMIELARPAGRSHFDWQPVEAPPE